MEQYVSILTSTNIWGTPITLTGVINIEYTRNYGVSISKINIKVVNIPANHNATEPGDQIRVFHKSSSPVGNAQADTYFKGIIKKRSIQDGFIIIEADDYLVKTQDKLGTTNYEDSSGTSIKTMLQEMCTLAGLTYDMDATAMSPSTRLKYDTTNQNLFGKILHLMGLVNWYFYFDAALDDVVFKPKSALTQQNFYFAYTGQTTNITELPNWVDDSGEVVNDVITIGGASKTSISSESHTYGDASHTDWVSGNGDSYKLDEPYQDMTITYVKIGTDAALSPGDYKTINYQSPDGTAIYFPSETQPTTGETFIVDYFFDKESSSDTASNATSITQYGEKEKAVNDRKVVDTNDLSDLADNLVSSIFWGKASEEVSIKVNSNTTSPILGSKAAVYDGIRNRSLIWSAGTTECIVVTTTESWPSGGGVTTRISTKSVKDPFAASHAEERYEGLTREVSELDITKLMHITGEKALTGDFDVGSNELINFRVHNVATNGMLSTTDAGSKGLLQFNTTDNKLYCYNGTSWVDVMGAGATDHGALTGLADNDHTQYLHRSGTNGGMGANLDMNDYNITSADTIQATTSEDLTLKVTAGRSIIFQAV